MRRLTECGVLLAALILVCGCQPVTPIQTTPETVVAPENTISVEQMAQRLGLSVEEDTPAVVTLRNAANRVMVVPDPGGQAFVNGMRIGPQGGIVRVGGVLYVPDALEGYIRSAMKGLPGSVAPARGLKPHPEQARPALARAYRIVVDPGHGGKDPGTISRAGLQEKTVTLPVAKELARLLKEDGFNVVLTRKTDVFVELDDRGAIANHFGADLFVSIHADACPDPFMRGFAVYTAREPSKGSATSRRP